MKVKELRSWLENFGEKHKQHYKRGNSYIPHVKQDDENRLLSIQTKPSNASTIPMSSSDSITSDDGASLIAAFSTSSTSMNDPARSFGPYSNPSARGEGDLHYPDPSFVDLSDESSVEDDGNLEEFQLFTETFHPNFEVSSTGQENTRRVTFGGIQVAGSLSAPINLKRTSLANAGVGTNSSSGISDVMINEMDQARLGIQKASIFRKKIDPSVFEFLQSSKHQAPSEEHSAQKPVRAPRSSVGAAIELFGGQSSRKTIVKTRTDELQAIWSSRAAVTHVKKTKWSVCEKTGVYKRKIVVEPEHKSA